MRSAFRLGIVAAMLLVTVVAGCKSTTGGSVGRGHPTFYEADPEFPPDEGVRVAMLGFANATQNADAVGYFQPHFEKALADKPQYVFLSKWTVEREARRKGARDDFKMLNEQWRKDRAFEPDRLQLFAEKMGYDYVGGGWLSEWAEVQVDANTEGYSYSEVEAGLKIIEVATNKTVWEAHDRFQMKSAYYDPTHRDVTIEGEAVRGGASQSVPLPPPVTEPADRVATALVSVLP
jgi:hypothetical protein